MKRRIYSGFTIVEMLAVLAIFTFLSTTVIMKYPDSTLKLKVSSLASELTGVFRDSQLRASSVDTLGQSTAGYGLQFSGSINSSYKQFFDKVTSNQVNGIFIGNLLYDGVLEDDRVIPIPEGFRINDTCVSGISISRPFTYCSSAGAFSDLTVTYERPNPEPTIFVNATTTTKFTAACIEIASDKLRDITQPEKNPGYVRNVIVTRTGLITSSLGPCSNLARLQSAAGTNTYVASQFAAIPAAGKPRALIIDSTDTLYTANRLSDDVSKVTTSGVISSLPLFGGSDPRGIAVDASGALYTANCNDASVSKTDINGVFAKIAVLPLGSCPRDIVVTSHGMIYTANSLTNDVAKIDQSGIVTLIALPPNQGPIAITKDDKDTIYTANYTGSSVSKIDSNDTVVTIPLGAGSVNPRAVKVDGLDAIYTANYTSNNVTKIINGVPSIIASTNGSGAYGMTLDLFGNIYVVNYASNNVTKINQSANTSVIVGFTDAGPNDIALDSLGNLYTVNYDGKTITKLTPQ